MNRFGYARDPLFLTGCALYALNRWWIKQHIHSAFFTGQFNDLLLIPCALPLILWVHRRLGWRAHDAPPTAAEVALHVAVWSIVCEVVGPHWVRTTGDPWDVVAYAGGGLLAWIWWHRPNRFRLSST